MPEFRSGRRNNSGPRQQVQRNARRSLRWICPCIAFLLLGNQLLTATVVAGPVGSGRSNVPTTAVTRLRYQLELQGTLIVSEGSSTARYPLQGSSEFQFLQHAELGASDAPGQIRAARQFSVAHAETVVGRDHRIQTQLPGQSTLIHVYQDRQQMIQLSPSVRLTRPQVDLLQFPCDPLPVTGLLDAGLLDGQGNLQVGQRWDVPGTLLPLLSGLDFCSDHAGDCVVRKIAGGVAEIAFQFECDGGIMGSASEIEVQGTLQYVADSRFVSSLQAELREKRSSGVISPGLDVTATIRWSAEKQSGETRPALPAAELPAASQQLLTLQTPWDLAMVISREWHVYREESDLMILRRLQSGALAGQLNLKRLPPLGVGEEPDEQKFLGDVTEQVASRGGAVMGSRVLRTAAGWRVHRVEAGMSVKSTQAEETAAGSGSQAAISDRVQFSYCLCTAPGGEQYSLVFSSLSSREESSGSEIEAVLQTLVLR